ISEKVTFFSERSVVDAKPFAIIHSLRDTPSLRGARATKQSSRARGSMDCFASLAMTTLIMFMSLLLLLLLLARVEHAALGQRNRLAQHLDVADMIGE